MQKTSLNEIRSLWIDSRYRNQKLGYGLMVHLIEKTKEKKYYVYIKNGLLEYYENFGFQEVKIIPENFQKRIKEAENATGELREYILRELKRLKQ